MTIHPLCGFGLLDVNVDVYRIPGAAPYDLRLSTNHLLKALDLTGMRPAALAKLKAYEAHKRSKMQQAITTPPARIETVVNLEGALFLMRLARPEREAFLRANNQLLLGIRSVFQAVVLPTLTEAEKVKAYREVAWMAGTPANEGRPSYVG